MNGKVLKRIFGDDLLRLTMTLADGFLLAGGSRVLPGSPVPLRVKSPMGVVYHVKNHIDFADMVVAEAIRRNWWIMVGDASGVDEAVVERSRAAKWDKLIVVGIERNGGLRIPVLDTMGCYTLVDSASRDWKESYLHRDTKMVEWVRRAKGKGGFFYCHNGSGGTMHTFKTAAAVMPCLLLRTNGELVVAGH